MKQSLIFIIMVLLLTIQTVFPQLIRNKPCPCGRAGPNCSKPIPQYCPHRFIKRNTTKPIDLPTRPILCQKGFFRKCDKDKLGKTFCQCKPTLIMKNKEIN